MRYRVSHVTRMDYQSPAQLARFNLRLEPVDWPGQTIDGFALSVDPSPGALVSRDGPYPFRQMRVELDHPFTTLEIRASFEASIEETAPDPAQDDPPIAAVARAALDSLDTGPWGPVHYIFPSQLLPGVPEIGAWARPLLPADAPALVSALALAEQIQRDFAYDAAATEADTPVAAAFAMRRGVCQDFAHILIEALRSVGLPAAYLSGYLRTTPPPGEPRLIGVDAMHAWVALWRGADRGWIGLDPTNGCVARADHVVTAMGRDYADVSPIDGIFLGGAGQRIQTVVDVLPLDE